MKGCICLDIDGTITSDPFHIPEEVVLYFEKLHAQGWQFLFSTGRPFAFAYKLLKAFSFPFYLSLQNGSDLLKMPERQHLSKEHLLPSVIPVLDQVYQEIKEDFLIYTGVEKGDFCYYRPHRFSLQMLEHLEVVQSLVTEPWQAVEEFAFSKEDSFPLIKGLGTKEEMEKLSKRLQDYPEVQATCIKDPLSKGNGYLNLITAKKATKGEVLIKLRKIFPKDAFFIAAGDDLNDKTMLQEADFAIVMKNATEEILSLADLIAEPASELGIINALERATGNKG